MTPAEEEQPARRLLHIKEIAEQIVEDLGGDPDLVVRDRVYAGDSERQLEKIGEAVKLLPEEVRQRQPDIHWGGWGSLSRSLDPRVRQDRARLCGWRPARSSAADRRGRGRGAAPVAR